MKGQASTELAVLLGAVVVLALVATFVLGGFSGIAHRASEDASRLYWGSARPFMITDWRFNSTHAVLVMKNTDLESQITIYRIYLDGLRMWVASPGWPVYFSPGEERTVVLQFRHSWSAYDHPELACEPSGTLREYTLRIEYQKEGIDVDFAQEGTVPVRVVCS